MSLRHALLLFFLSRSGASPEAVRYDVYFENAARHEAEIEVTFRGLPGSPLDVLISRSSPGRYALHPFSKNVRDVKAFDGKGRKLSVARPNSYQWRVAGHDGTVRFTYTLSSNRADGTYSGIDGTHAHLNMPATFVWARGLDRRPIVIRFHVPEEKEWKVATQLPPGGESNTFQAPDLGYFFDSPTELSDFTLREWTVTSGEKASTFRLVVHHHGTEADVDTYRELAQSVVREEEAIFGRLPEFDYATYTFIADYLPSVEGDGMEHRNSTFLTSTLPLSTAAAANLSTLAHEFFHVWNVERMRPRSLEPFDFERANTSSELWFAEGFTSYYESLVLARVSVLSLDRFAERIAGALNQVVLSPARKSSSAVEMSRRATVMDIAGSHRRTASYISYYPYGCAIALGLDLTLRTRYPGSSLDRFMRAAWEAHPGVEKPYTNDDLEKILAVLTGDARFASEFFRKYVQGPDVPDYGELLSHAGLLLRQGNDIDVATYEAAGLPVPPEVEAFRRDWLGSRVRN